MTPKSFKRNCPLNFSGAQKPSTSFDGCFPRNTRAAPSGLVGFLSAASRLHAAAVGHMEQKGGAGRSVEGSAYKYCTMWCLEARTKLEANDPEPCRCQPN